MAKELASSVASKVVELFYDIVQREISYVFKYQRYVKELRSQLEDLENQLQRVKQRVEDAEKQGDDIFDDVKKWLSEVNDFTERVHKSINEEEENAKNKRCFMGLCPNLMTRHKLGKEAEKDADDVVDLLRKANFSEVSHRPPLERTENIDRGYQLFDSRMKVFQDVMEALKDSTVNMIGVHGMGGVGKTTLAKQVQKKVIEEKLIFDEVVMAEVTQTPNLKTIQDKIASDLGLKFGQNDSEYERANQLRQRLKKEKRVLVILDNIWGKLELKDFGIPLRDDQKEEKDGQRRCAVLLTSRYQRVLSDDMKTQKNFRIEELSDGDAMSLFWKIVDNHSMDTSDFQPLAVEIVKKCGGLPVAIKTIANALKNKGLSFWKDALDLLRNSNPTKIPGMDKNLYSSIELSYKFLESEEEKSLFRICGLLNDGSRIPIDDLMRYGIALDMFRNAHTLEARRNRVHALVNNLKTSCLLLDGESKDDVKMHDVIHVVAKLIAADALMFNIHNAADTKEELEYGIQRDAIAISLHYGDVQELPEMLKCPKLRLFLLFEKHGSSLQIPDLIFEGMEELRALHITGVCFLPLPSSLGFLINLRTLSFINCQLEDVAIVGKLKKLEMLSFRSSNIEQLPVEIRQLTRLKFLDLSMCSELRVIAPNVISKLSQLEELYMDSFAQWENVEEQRNASLVELKELSKLKALDIRIPDIQVMQQNLLFVEFERYKISVGDKLY